MLKILLFSSIFSIQMAHKNLPILIFLKMHTDMTSVTIQSNKIVSNEVKDD